MAELAVNKTERLNLRTTPQQDYLIRRAATAKGQNVTDFVLASAVRSASRTIAKFERMVLSVSESQAFVDALLNSPEPNARALAAAKRYKEALHT